MHNNSKPSSSFAPVIITMDGGELCHSYLTTCHFGALAVITAAVPLLGQTLSNYCICSTVRKVVSSTCLRDKRLELPLPLFPHDAINDQKTARGIQDRAVPIQTRTGVQLFIKMLENVKLLTSDELSGDPPSLPPSLPHTRPAIKAPFPSANKKNSILLLF